jgi:hypothetical protein
VPVPSRVRERVRAFLEPGEEIRYLFPAMALMGPHLGHFLVVVTDVSVTLVSTGGFSRTRPKSVWSRYPRDVRLGPVDTSAGPRFFLGGTYFEIDDEYVAVINAADAEAASADPLPPDPLPGQ